MEINSSSNPMARNGFSIENYLIFRKESAGKTLFSFVLEVFSFSMETNILVIAKAFCAMYYHRCKNVLVTEISTKDATGIFSDGKSSIVLTGEIERAGYLHEITTNISSCIDFNYVMEGNDFGDFTMTAREDKNNFFMIVNDILNAAEKAAEMGAAPYEVEIKKEPSHPMRRAFIHCKTIGSGRSTLARSGFMANNNERDDGCL